MSAFASLLIAAPFLGLSTAPAGGAHAAPFAQPRTAAADAPFDDVPLQRALELAREQQKPVFAYFWAEWCEPCEDLDLNVWPDASLQAFLDESFAAAVRWEETADHDMHHTYGIRNYPTILFLDGQGEEITRMLGYLRAPELIARSKRLLAGDDPVRRAQDALQQDPADPHLRLALVSALMEEGRYPEALEEAIWCWDHGLDGDHTDFAQKRHGELAEHLGTLLEKMPEEHTRTQLVGRRIEAERVVCRGVVDPDHGPAYVRDVALLNRLLGEQERNDLIYDRLLESGDERALYRRVLLPEVLDKLLARKRYQDILADAAYLEEQVLADTRAAEALETSEEPLTPMQERELARLRERLRERGGALVEALLAEGHVERAHPHLAVLVSLSYRDGDFAELMKRALRADQPEVARGIYERALAALPDPERRKRTERQAAKLEP